MVVDVVTVVVVMMVVGLATGLVEVDGVTTVASAHPETTTLMIMAPATALHLFIDSILTRVSFVHCIVADRRPGLRHNRGVSLQTDIAASHLETLIERLTGVHKAVPDAEGDYAVHLRGATFMTRIDGDDEPICRVYAIISDGVEKTSELLDALNAINTRLVYLRIIWVRSQILLEGNHLALNMDETEFAAMCNDIANAANAFGDALVSDFGGAARFKASQDSDYLKVREGHGPIYL